MVDYSKWNNIAVSSDEEDEAKCNSEKDEVASEFEKKHSVSCVHSKLSHHQKRPAFNLKESEEAASTLSTIRKPELPIDYVGSPIQRMQYSEAWRAHRKYLESHSLVFDPKIHIHIKDKISEIHPIFFTDPLKWVPKQNEMGCFVEWGIQDVYTDFMAFNLRRMAVQLLYGEWAKEKAVDLVSEEPALQFVSALAWRKEQSVFANRNSLPYSFPSLECLNREKRGSNKNQRKKEAPPDFILDISILSLKPKTWRRIKVSAATSLSIFHDKIISPAFGWTRNYHAYVFTDQRDGALFGPVNSNAIDMMHLPSNGYLMLDDSRFFLGDVLQNVNDTLTYDYDLGDHFEHVIKLVQIINKNPDGKCVVLDGAGCPLPEDSVGSPGYKGVQGYQALLDAWPKNSLGKKKALQNTISQALNYSGKAPFEPGWFDLSACQVSMQESWMTRASLQEGSKMVLFSAKGQGPPSSLHIPGSGRKEVVIAVEKGISYLKQVVTTRRDPKWNAICATCGNPNNLKACGCRGIWYCSVGCQKSNRSRHQDYCDKRSEFRKLMLEKNRGISVNK